MVVALVILWLVAGGASAVARTARTFTNPVALIFGSGTSTGFFVTLPWQISVPQGPDISGYANGVDAGGQSNTPGEYLDRYNALNARAEALRTFGNPSPYEGEVTLANGDTSASDPAKEYVALDATETNTEPIDITGWSLQSAVSGTRLFIPPAASPFVLGTLNSTERVHLDPGGSAFAISGTSPVGVSFRENICSGYLAELQQFAPELARACPAPSDVLTETPDSLRIYGSACFDYVKTVPECHFPATGVPANLSSTCRTFLVDTLTYNGCINTSRSRSDFLLPTWRIYLNARAELWDNAHDIIRLLDAQGHTVDVLTY
jgi:hypothetical protein